MSRAKKIISSAGALAILVGILVVLDYFLLDTICLFKNLTGLPSPGCGLTRASLSLLRLDFATAAKLHPLVFVMPFIFGVAVWVYFKPSIAKRKIFKVGVVLCFMLVLAVYIVRMVMFFPHTAPMDYTYNSLVGWLIGMFRG